MDIFDIALTMTPGLGVRGAVHLLEHFGTAVRIFSASQEELVAGAHLREDVARRIVRREALRQAEREADYCRRHAIKAVASTDPDYPQPMRLTPDYPHVIYVRGSVGALSCRTLSMVGTREITPTGQRMCQMLVEGLCSRLGDLSVVSGLAYGVDAACHRAALAYGAKTVAVVANALPDVTPAPHRRLAEDIVSSGGAIVSELHSQTRQNGSYFLARNRIVAALGAGLVVVESPASGGSLSTAAIADSYGRTVMALPGRATDTASRGTNNLIRNNKARLVMTADDIIEELGWQTDSSRSSRVAEAAALTAAEATLLSCFADDDTLDLQRLADASSLSVGELSQLLMQLELKGVVRCLPGRRYEKL